MFQVSWLSDPEFKSWLAYDETNGVMTCRFCLASSFDNNFTRGCKDLQRSALVRHINPIICKDHSRAVADAEQRKANAIAVRNTLKFQEAAVDMALKTVYWLAKEVVASMKFPSLMQLLTMFGDPDVHHLRAEDPTRRGMSLTYESSQFFVINWQFCSAKFDMKRLSSINVLGKCSESDSFLGNGREEKCAAKCIKIPKNGRFRNIKFQIFPGEHAPGPP